MLEKYKSTLINFEFQQGNGNLIVFLHGWGTKIKKLLNFQTIPSYTSTFHHSEIVQHRMNLLHWTTM